MSSEDQEDPQKVRSCFTLSRLSASYFYLAGFSYFWPGCLADSLFSKQLPIWHRWRHWRRPSYLHVHFQTQLFDALRHGRLFMCYFSLLGTMQVHNIHISTMYWIIYTIIQLCLRYNWSKTKFEYGLMKQGMQQQAMYEGTKLEREIQEKSESVQPVPELTLVNSCTYDRLQSVLKIIE